MNFIKYFILFQSVINVSNYTRMGCVVIMLVGWCIYASSSATLMFSSSLTAFVVSCRNQCKVAIKVRRGDGGGGGDRMVFVH